MYERTDLQFLQDILESINAALEFVAGCDLDSFTSDRKTKSATCRWSRSAYRVAVWAGKS